MLNHEGLIDELKEKYEIVIPIKVVEELDNIKQNSTNDSLKYFARKSIHSLKNNYDLITFDLINEADKSFDEEINDNKIVSCAKRNNALLITDDMNLKVKAYSLGLECLDIEDKVVDDEYNGVKEIVLSEQNLIYLYEHNRENIYDCLINQYLIVKDEKGIILYC